MKREEVNNDSHSSGFRVSVNKEKRVATKTVASLLNERNHLNEGDKYLVKREGTVRSQSTSRNERERELTMTFNKPTQQAQWHSTSQHNKHNDIQQANTTSQHQRQRERELTMTFNKPTQQAQWHSTSQHNKPTSMTERERVNNDRQQAKNNGRELTMTVYNNKPKPMTVNKPKTNNNSNGIKALVIKELAMTTKES
jgi:hypothetical protein